MPENELKWQWVRPGPDSYDFSQFDAIVDYAMREGMELRAHTLFWTPPQWYPKWLAGHDFGSRPAAAAETMLADHVRTVLRRYGNRIYSYDVVNESVDPETGKIRDTVVTKAIDGDAMHDVLFHTAKSRPL